MTPLGGAGVGKAESQLRPVFRLVALLFSVHHVALPRLEARIVVPHTELREAERKLRRTSGGIEDSVPGGNKFTVFIRAAAA